MTAPAEAQTLLVEDPASGAVIGQVPDHGVAEGLDAVGRAHEAFASWRRRPARARAEVLMAAHQGMLAQLDRLRDLIAAENGKSSADAEAEVRYAAEFFRWYAEEAVRAGGDYGPAPAGGARTVVTRHPVGVAALVTPWNFPAAMATRKIAPALAAGCTVVLKPASETPLTALAIAGVLAEAGVPEGVVSVITTSDAAAVVGAWLADSRVRKLSFTGSTGVGRRLLRQCADRVVNASMELGGNAPFIVTEDADLDDAVAGAMIAKFRNGGQACTAANRFYVHERVCEEFTARLGTAVEALRVGPAASGADIGPLISARAVHDVTRLVERAVAQGAHVAHRASLPAEPAGHFVAPAVLADVPRDAEILEQEIFGPIAPVVSWREDAEVIAMANAAEVGLAAYVYAGDLQRAMTLAESVEAGMVGINRGIVSDPSAPFGGMKQSGLGREGARDGLLEFTETQYMSIAWPEA